MNKKLINSIIMLLASGVCFFFAITGLNIGIYHLHAYNEASSSVNELKDAAKKATSDYVKELYEKRIKSFEEKLSETTGPLIRNAFTGFLLSIAGICGIVFAVRYFIGKNHYCIFSWIAAGVTTAAAIAYLVGAIVAMADKKTYSFNMLAVKDSPLGVFFILFAVLYVLILGAQFITILFAKSGENVPLTFSNPAPAAPAAPAPVAPIAPTPAPAAPVAPVTPAPAAPIAPEALVDQPVENPGMPTAA